jgi:uncharacterized protein (DUF885 family)
MPMLNRRDLMMTAAAGGALAAAGPTLAQPIAPPADAATAKLYAVFDTFMQERLAAHPEMATSLGLDKGPLAGQRFKLSDNSLAGVAADKAMTASELARMQAIDPSRLHGLPRINYEAVIFGLRTGDAADRAFDFGDNGARSPYVLSQLTGAYQSVPTFLDTQHKVNTAEDAEAYLSRLQAFSHVLDNDTERARHDTGLGMIPPDFILDKAMEQMQSMSREGSDDSTLVKSIVRRTADKAIPGDWGKRASAIYADAVAPALQRQIDQVRDMRAHATSAAGIGSRPQGMAYYAAGLLNYTTSSLTPEEVHRIGLEQTRAYQARIDEILRAQGMTQGSVGARLTALSTDPKYIYPDTEAGKAQLIAHLNDLVAEITPRLPRDFRRPPTVPLEIRRVPPNIEAGAPLGYYSSASLDGSRPAIYYINLAHTADWPRWLVSSVTFHEGVPGHHLQISTAQHISGQPLIRKTGNYSGYAEGWALYAEQLADELGMYDNDPLGRVGYLKSELWRACRMVLDTGIHTMGWTRDQAIRWKMENDGSLESGTANEVDRYCVWPGQAPSYKIGHTVINQLRDTARASLGPRFDIKDFHDVVLDSGSVPLEVLKGMGARYAATGSTVV